MDFYPLHKFSKLFCLILSNDEIKRLGPSKKLASVINRFLEQNDSLRLGAMVTHLHGIVIIGVCVHVSPYVYTENKVASNDKQESESF